METPTLKKLLHRLLVIAWYGIASVIVLSAVFLTLVRLLLPLAEDYRDDIQAALSDYAGQPVSVEHIEAEWVGIQPQLKFTNVRLYDETGSRVQFEFAQARMGINLVASLTEQDFVPSGFIMRGINLTVTRHADGSFQVEGLSQREEASAQDYTQTFINWLLRQSDIGIESSTLTWTDKPFGENGLVFSNVNLRLRNDGGEHRLDAKVGLPARLGKHLELRLDMQGQPDDFSRWSGEIYLKGQQLQLPAWWRGQLPNHLKLTSGVVDTELWGKLADSRIHKLDGELSLASFELSGERAAPVNMTALRTDLLWSQASDGWNLHLARFRPVFAGREWLAGNVTVRADTRQQRFALVMEHAELADVLPLATALAPLQKEQLSMFSGIQPVGQLRDVSVLFAEKTASSNTTASWHVDASFKNLTTKFWQDIPGVDSLDGKLVASDAGGTLQVAGKSMHIDFGKLFRDRLQFETLQAKLGWQKQANGWQFRSQDISVKNADIALRSQFEMLLPADGSSPVIDLLADFENGQAVQAGKYLPLTVISAETDAWLKKAIVAGTSPRGKVVLRGPLDKFPFDDGEGRFEVRFDVVNGALDYESGWPVISDMEGEVVFSGRGMDIIGNKGRIFNAHVHDVKAHIHDLDVPEPILELKGHVDADASDVIRYLVDSNVASGYSKQLKQLDSRGKIAIYLDINLPTISGEGTIRGNAKLDRATFRLPEYDVALQKVSGKLAVTNAGISGKDLSGEVFGQRVKLQVSHDDDASTALSLKALGRFDLNKLLKQQFSKDLPIIAMGESDWQANLSFHNPDGKHHPVSLELKSNMQGTTVDLPEPFAKKTSAIKPVLAIAKLIDEQHIQLEVDYGDDISMIIALLVKGKQVEYAGSSVAFGGELPVPPASPRLTITGQLNALSLDEWQTYLQKPEFTVASDNKDKSRKKFDWLEHVNLKVTALQAMGSSFSINRFRFENEPSFEHWHTYIDADRARGEIRIPYDTSIRPIEVNMALLRIDRSQHSDSDASYDPRQLPPLKVKIDRFVFDGAQLGELTMNTVRSEKGVFMEQLQINGEDAELTASGSWEVVGDEQLTRLRAKLKSDNFSKLLKDLGYSPGFEAGKSRNNAQLEWPGNPLQVAPGKLSGTMRIKILDGQLLDVSPGAGRIVGLLSLQTLPRRLTLDFSDLFKKGFSFDRIKGSFQVERGDAYTTDLYLEGPAARVDVSGRTGLGTRDYDQLITVTPNLTDSFSVIGTLLGGPAVGVGAYAVDKLLSPAIDRISSYKYAVTGSWDEPNVSKLGEKDIAPAAENEASQAP